MVDNLYSNIKAIRKQKGISQTKLAELVGYTHKSMISKIESGKIDLSRDKIIEFANALDVPVSELLGFDELQLKADAISVLLEGTNEEFCKPLINIINKYKDSDDETKQKMVNFISAYSDTLI